MRIIAFLLVLASSGCSNGVTPNDAANADASSDCAFGGAYSYGSNGGFAPNVTSMLTGRATWSRTSTSSMPPPLTCTVPCASGHPGVTVESVNAALADSDVMAALASTFPPVYGVDNRPVDGVAWSFTRTSDGQSFTVGSPCGTDPGCVAIPPGIAALRTLLDRLDAQEAAQSDCTSP
jgi:hypothetical protein